MLPRALSLTLNMAINSRASEPQQPQQPWPPTFSSTRKIILDTFYNIFNSNLDHSFRKSVIVFEISAGSIFYAIAQYMT